MRDKNVRRAAHALYLSQGDDKNSKIAEKISNEFVRDLVKDQGRVLVLLEKIILPRGKDAYDEEEMYSFLRKKLLKKGHRIQSDEEEDTKQYAQEKESWEQARKLKVPDVFEVGLNLPPKKEKEEKSKALKPTFKSEKSNSEELVSIRENIRLICRHSRNIYHLVLGK